jgi:NitT/TauT family transport system substrate-binding protein
MEPLMKTSAPTLSSRRNHFFKPALGLALSLATLSSFAQSAPSMKIATVVWIGYGPFYVAEALDLYKKYNLKVSLQVFNDPALIPAAIASGAVDGGMLTYDQVVGQVAAGRNMKVVMPIDYSNGGDAIVADGSITKVADFKGKKIGYNPLSPSDFLLSYALKTVNLTEKDITPVSMTPEAVPAAMASGQLPIGVTYEPSLSQILSQGGGKKFKVVFSSKNAPGLIADVLVFDDKVIKAKPAQITGVMKAYLDGLAERGQRHHRQVHGRVGRRGEGTAHRRLQHSRGRDAQGLHQGQGNHLVLRQRRDHWRAAQGQRPDHHDPGD